VVVCCTRFDPENNHGLFKVLKTQKPLQHNHNCCSICSCAVEASENLYIATAVVVTNGNLKQWLFLGFLIGVAVACCVTFRLCLVKNSG